MSTICKRCLLREMAEQDQAKIARYREAIRGEDRVSADEYERRLSVCKGCDRLNSGTCSACGCYVELRALGKESRCPYKLW